MSQGQSTGNPYSYQYEQPQQTAHGYGQANPYSQDNYELQDYNAGQPQQRPTLTQNEFLDRVGHLRNEIKSLTNDIEYIGQLHQRALSSPDGQAKDQLESYVSQTQIKNTSIKDRIKGLEKDLANTTDSSRNTKKTQIESAKTLFKAELQKFQSLENDYQHRYREQIARQYRIVNPDASEQEVQEAASANWGDEGVFQTAIKTNRTGHAQSALGNVRARHNELQRIEQTLAELSILYQELAAVVEQQDPVVQAAETNAEDTVQRLEEGNKHTKSAADHLRRARKLKWWCLFIVVLIIIAIAIGVAAGICINTDKCKSKK